MYFSPDYKTLFLKQNFPMDGRFNRVSNAIALNPFKVEKDLEIIEQVAQQTSGSEASIESALIESDLVIGAVYVIGKQAPKVVTNSMLKQMKPGAVMVDISIDQGGCFESSKPTTHANPTYDQDGIIHYCVTNMPGAVPLTATQALNKATLPYILELANRGIDNALSENKHLANGLNIKNSEVVHEAVKEALSIAS